MIRLVLIFAIFLSHSMLGQAWRPRPYPTVGPRPSTHLYTHRHGCPYGPCEVPQCCENGIAVKVSQKNFGGWESKKCYDRGCFSCLSQQYLLGIHERCSLDQSLMKSLCAPGLSCMIYCSEKIEGEEACWHKYGTCQHKHIPKLANQQYPGNVTTIPGLTTDDAKKAPLCTHESTMCKCRSDKCESKHGEKPWCFVSYIRNPAHPTQNCFNDVRWSATYGSFYSNEACMKIQKVCQPNYHCKNDHDCGDGKCNYNRKCECPPTVCQPNYHCKNDHDCEDGKCNYNRKCECPPKVCVQDNHCKNDHDCGDGKCNYNGKCDCECNQDSKCKNDKDCGDGKCNYNRCDCHPPQPPVTTTTTTTTTTRPSVCVQDYRCKTDRDCVDGSCDYNGKCICNEECETGKKCTSDLQCGIQGGVPIGSCNAYSKGCLCPPPPPPPYPTPYKNRDFEERTAEDDDIPVLNNFDNIAVDEISAEEIPEPQSAESLESAPEPVETSDQAPEEEIPIPEPEEQEVSSLEDNGEGDDFYWNFDEEHDEVDEALAETADAPQASAEGPEESGDGKIDASQLLGDKR